MILATAAGAASAQGTIDGTGQALSHASTPIGHGTRVAVLPNDPLMDPESPEARAYAALRREQKAIERELNSIRVRHFGTLRNVERRQIGLMKIRHFTSAAALVVMTEAFDDEQPDVREAVLDHFASLANADGDAALAWEGVHGEDEWYRERARELLVDRMARMEKSQESGAAAEGENAASDAAAGEDNEEVVSARIRGIIAGALSQDDDNAAVAAGRLAHMLRLYEFIPMMATAQVARPAGGQDRTGDLAWIMIGRQQTFVADLVPVVSNAAVGLDPQIGVVSDGVMLRVHDAVVTVYRTDLYRELVAMTSDAWGRPTDALGYNPDAWGEWYTKEFVPFLTAKADATETAPVDD
ncbi:MAG: hypothetical protein H6810_01890 [Phycisphaeraceae bacterium]|nr:MAG: hypothetical protein H6810_01890 [Phycisphaeraceae bacterium]